MGGELVQVAGGGDLRVQHRRQGVGVGVRHGGVGEDPGGVDDHAQVVHGGQQRPQRRAVGGVAGHHPDLGPGLGEVGEQFRRGVAAAAEEHQAADAVPRGQVAGDESAEDTGAAGDQGRAAGVDRCRHGQHVLAGVPAGGHDAQRGAGVPDVPGPGG